MSPRARSLFPMLSVADLERSMAFYRDTLGGRETHRFAPDGDADFVVLRLGESDVGLGRQTDAPLHGQPQRPAAGHRIELCVYVDDVDATIEALRTIGATIAMEPADQPWGERVAYAEDPDGNLVMLTR